MTTPARALALALAAAGGPLALPGAALAATPTVATAPGRVVISLDGGAIAETPSAGVPAGPAVVLPDGGVVALAAGPAGPAELVKLTAAGAIDTTFGSGGTAMVTPGLAGLGVLQIVRQPDGKLVLVGREAAAVGFQLPRIVVIRLNPDASLDPSFGTGGIDVLPIGGGCACSTLAIRPTGGFVVAGETGREPMTDPARPATTAAPQTQWVVAGLTSTGALDPSFGASGVATVAGSGTAGSDLAVLPDGDVVVDGYVSAANLPSTSELTRLLPTGAPDPAFNGGTPQTLPAGISDGGLLGYPDGTVIVAVPHAIVRYTAAGLPDQSFGSGGIVQTASPNAVARGQLLPAAGDGAVVFVEGAPAYAQGHDRAERILGNGAVAIDPTRGGPDGVEFTTPFGGGSSRLLTVLHPQPLAPLGQNTFNGTVLQRPDGSFVLVGGVAVSEPTGEGTGRSIEDFAAIGLTPSFGLETAFGGPAAPLRATVAVLDQRAATAVKRHGIRVALNVSAPGLAQVTIKGSGRVVAQSVLPVFAPARTILPVQLTNFGSTWLKRHPRGNLTVSLKARDLLTNTATADTGPVRLR